MSRLAVESPNVDEPQPTEIPQAVINTIEVIDHEVVQPLNEIEVIDAELVQAPQEINAMPPEEIAELEVIAEVVSPESEAPVLEQEDEFIFNDITAV